MRKKIDELYVGSIQEDDLRRLGSKRGAAHGTVKTTLTQKPALIDQPETFTELEANIAADSLQKGRVGRRA